MHKRTLHSLLIVSFIAVFAASMSFAADEVIVESKGALLRCAAQSVDVTANIDADVSAIEIVLDVSNYSGCGDITNVSVTSLLGTGILTDQVTDLTQYPLIRFAAMSTGSATEYQAAGTGVPIIEIGFETVDCDAGEVEIAGATWPSSPPFGPIVTQFVDAATSTIRTVAVTAGIVGMENKPAFMTEIVGGPFELLHGDLFEYTLESTDADLAQSCEIHTYAVVSGPDGMTVESGNILTWQTDGDDVCEFDGDVIISVTDKYGETDDADPFTIFVTNNPPEFTVVAPATNEIAWGMEYCFDFDAVDPDPGPYENTYTVASFDGPGTPGFTGSMFCWQTDYLPEFTGTFHVCVEVSDLANTCPGAEENSDSYCFEISVVPFQLTIEKVEHVYIGQPVTVSITMLDDTYVNKDMGGFDFLIAYDASAMAFQSASEGEFLTDCEWEYFTYRYGAAGNCGVSACPTGVLRVVAMAETTGGNLAHHPLCLTNEGGASNELVQLNFLVSTDANLECNYAPIRWIWYDCADNGVSSDVGDFLFISDKVYDFAGFDGVGDPIFEEILVSDESFPTMTGAPEVCDVFTDKGQPWRLIHFYNGGLDIECADSIDAVGDININSIPYEIADAVMFTNYFINGLAAFGGHIEGSIAASDTNKDGITLSVADLVYLIRVIVGDALPYAKTEPVLANITYGNSTFGADLDMGAAHIVLEGNVTPTLLATNMDMKVGFDGQNTNVLVYSISSESFTGNFLQAEGRIVSTEFATYEGQPVVAKVVPTTFEVSQNYPNPFNPTTKIRVQVPNAGAWSMDIYNINGQLVDSFSGVSESGFEDVIWDASALSSGVYFYKVVAGQHSLTKKAVLLK